MTEEELLHIKLNTIINMLVLMPGYINAAAAQSSKDWEEVGRQYEAVYNNLLEDIKRFKEQNDNSGSSSIEDKIS